MDGADFGVIQDSVKIYQVQPLAGFFSACEYGVKIRAGGILFPGNAFCFAGFADCVTAKGGDQEIFNFPCTNQEAECRPPAV